MCELHLAGRARSKVWRVGEERGGKLWGTMLSTHNQAILVTYLLMSFSSDF